MNADKRQDSLMRAIAILFTIPLSLLAQQPFISAVVNDATSDAHFSPGSIIRFNGADLPLSFSATLDGKPAAQLGKLSTIVARFQLPVDAPIGPATLVANLGAGKTQQFTITLDQFAPSIYEISPFYPVHSGDPHTHCFLGATAPGGLVTAYGGHRRFLSRTIPRARHRGFSLDSHCRGESIWQ